MAQAGRPSSSTSCFCGFWRACGAGVLSICEPVPDEESPWKRLELMHQERERQEAEQKAEAARLELEKRQHAIEMEQHEIKMREELEELKIKRLAMTEDELEESCRSYWASYEYLRQGAQAPLDEEDVQTSDVPDADRAVDDVDVDNAADPEEPIGVVPTGPLEEWLADRFGDSAGCHACGDGPPDFPRPRSFGELPPEALAPSHGATVEASDDIWAAPQPEVGGLLSELANVLQRVVDEAMETLAQLEGTVVKVDCLSDLDRLLQEFDDSSGDEHEKDSSEAPCALSVADLALKVEACKARVATHAAVSKRLLALQHCLKGDASTTRFAAALAVLDLAGTHTFRHVPAHVRSFRAPLCSLSSLDVCWALISEKKSILIEQMLPGVNSGGQWSWPELRLTGIGWWLCGEGSEQLLDSLVTKLAQSAMKQLRDHENDIHVEFNAALAKKTANAFVDRAIFWSVMQGATLAKLKILAQTGALKADPSFSALIKHPKIDEPDFLRRNAWKVLQLRRHHLAAAFFWLSGGLDEAARVLSGHHGDFQLALLMCRRHPDIVAPLLLDRLTDSPLATQDPSLRFLLAWRAGDLDAARRAAAEAMDESRLSQDQIDNSGSDKAPAVLLFDDTLRTSVRCASLREVALKLLGPDALAAPPLAGA